MTFAYDANANVTSMTDGAGIESYVYDALNRTASVSRGTDTFSYAYDAAGNLTSRTYPGELVTIYTYDDAGRLASATADGLTTSYGYDAAGHLLTVATPDGITARQTWDRAGRLLEVAHTTASATLSKFSYALDPVGNRIAMTTREGTVTYFYDALDRLTESCWSATSCPGGPPAAVLPCLACIGGLLSRPSPSTSPDPADTFRSYSYDPVGNRTTEVSHAGTTSYAYDAADRLTSVTAPDGAVTSYSFDANGNQTAAGASSFSYDLADRLLSATVAGTTESYTYAGDGTRLSAATGSQANKTTNFIWDRHHPLPQIALERNGNDQLLRRYTYGLDLLRQTAGNSAAWYHHDGLGSVADLTDPNAKSLAWSEYYPYGLVLLHGADRKAPAVQPFRFTGQQLDAVTGLYHLRARQYDPSTGRFLTQDPLAPTLEDPYVASYVYVRDNPILDTDPTGLITGQLCLVADAGLGFFFGGSVCLAADSEGNIGVLLIGESGGTSLARAGIGVGIGGTSAPTLHDLGGTAGLAGGTANIGPVSLTGEGLFGRDDAGQSYGGFQGSAGTHLPLLGVEIHAAPTFTAEWSFNPFDMLFGQSSGK